MLLFNKKQANIYVIYDLYSTLEFQFFPKFLINSKMDKTGKIFEQFATTKFKVNTPPQKRMTSHP